MENKETVFSKEVTISAAPSKVWETLTDLTLIKQWMSETEIEVLTDWKVGSPMIIRGPWYKSYFENTGSILAFEPQHLLKYSHLSSLSRLPDKPESYTDIGFTLTPDGDKTILALSINNFPTETIYKHLAFYWNVTLELLKKFIEGLS